MNSRVAVTSPIFGRNFGIARGWVKVFLLSTEEVDEDRFPVGRYGGKKAGHGTSRASGTVFFGAEQSLGCLTRVRGWKRRRAVTQPLLPAALPQFRLGPRRYFVRSPSGRGEPQRGAYPRGRLPPAAGLQRLHGGAGQFPPSGALAGQARRCWSGRGGCKVAGNVKG